MLSVYSVAEKLYFIYNQKVQTMAERVSKLCVLGALRGDKSLDFSAFILPKFRPLPLPCFPCRLNSASESILREAVLGYEVNSAFM